MASDITTIHGQVGLNGESQSYASVYASVVAQWAQGWERRLRDEAVGRVAEVIVIPHPAAAPVGNLTEESGCC